MTDGSVQYSGNDPLSMENIQKIVGSALHKNKYSSNMMDHSKETGSFQTPVSLSVSNSMLPTAATTRSANFGKYQYSNICQNNDPSSLGRPYSSTCCNEPYTTQGLTSNTHDSYRCDNVKPEYADSSDRWVDYQFNRLVTDRKAQQKPTVKESSFLSRYDHGGLKSSTMKSVEDIIREYSINPVSNTTSSQMIPKSCAYSSATAERTFRSEWMNRSHNNEHLETSSSEVEQVRRIGSSVDGKIGDASEALSAKCSLTNGRCKTPGSSNMHLQTSEDYKDYKRPDGIPSDSEVDSKEATTQKELNDVRSEMADLSYSFQKERDRLRHIETLIKKTPVGGTSSSSTFYQPRLNNRYSSRFLSDLSERRTYSTPDYSKYTTGSDWRSSSPHKDYLGRTSSSPSYKNFMTSNLPRSNYWTDFTASQQQHNGYESARPAAPYPHVYDTEMGKHNIHFNDTSDTRYNSKSKLNRSMNARKEKLSTKPTGSHKYRQKPSSRSHVSDKPSGQKARGLTDHSDNRRQLPSDDLFTGHYGNRPCSPSSSSGSEKAPIPKRKTSNKLKAGKYKSYQPLDFDRYFPSRAKSESSSLNTSHSSSCPAPEVTDPGKYAWRSQLSSHDDGIPATPITGLAERVSRAQTPRYGNSSVDKSIRCHSGGPVKATAQGWVDEQPNTVQPINGLHPAPKRTGPGGKRVVRKTKATKPKKLGRSSSRPKKKAL